MSIKHACLCIPCAGLCIAGSALAQQAAKASVLEEVVVTAQKRAQDLQEVPVAVTAITDEKRDLIGITTIEDMTNFVPGFYYDALLDRADIRGVGRVTNAPGSDPGVALYTDGFYSSSTTAAGRSTIFNERVEVLRGPQGTLYGRNATGGALNTVSRGAYDKFGAEFRAGYGAYQRKIAEGTVTGPIASWLRFRVTGSWTKQDGGYFRNIAPGYPDEGGTTNDKNYSALFAGDFGKRLEYQLRYSYSKTQGNQRFSATFTPYSTNISCTAQATCSLLNTALGTAATTFATFASAGPSSLYNTATNPANPAAPFLNPASPQYLVLNPATPDNRRVFNANTPADRVLEGSHTVVTNLNWHLSGMDLKWIGGFNTYKFYSLTDFDNTGRDFYDYTPPSNTNTVRIFTQAATRFFEDKQYWSNELNLASTGSGPLQWLLGLYQYHENYFQVPIGSDTRNEAQPELRAVYARPTALPSGTTATAVYDSWTTLSDPNPNGTFNAVTTGIKVNSYAVFSQGDWQFAKKWSATLGARYSWDMKEGYELRRNIMWDPTWAGSHAKAFDNTPPASCYTQANDPDAANRNLQLVHDATTGLVTPIANCRYRFMQENTWKDWSGTAGLNWKLADATLAYLKYSRGYKSGGIRLGSFNTDSIVDPERLNSYELGVKTDIGKRVQINSSVFFYDYRGYQFPLTFRDENNVARTEFANIPKAQSYGLELETTWIPFDSLTLLVNYSYLKTQIKSSVYILDLFDRQATSSEASPDVIRVANATQPGGFDVYQNAKGSSLPSSPENKISGTILYRWTLLAGSLTPSATYSWRDKVSNSTGLLARSTTSTPAYGTADVRATWADSKGRYSIIGFVRNVLDDDTYNTATPTTFNGEIVQVYNLNPPRTWGMEFQYRFGSEVR